MSARTYVDVQAVATRYGYSTWHIYELARTCRLPHRKRPGGKALLFDPDELDRFDDGGELEVKRLPRGGRAVRVRPS